MSDAPTPRSAEMVFPARVYVYVDLEGREVTHVEIDFDRQPASYDGPDGTRDEAWSVALAPGRSPWPSPSWC